MHAYIVLAARGAARACSATRGENCEPSGFLVALLGRPVTAKKRREGVRWCARRGKRRGDGSREDPVR